MSINILHTSTGLLLLHLVWEQLDHSPGEFTISEQIEKHVITITILYRGAVLAPSRHIVVDFHLKHGYGVDIFKSKMYTARIKTTTDMGRQMADKFMLLKVKP